ncbi:MAG: hypothetical protein WBD31_08405 [Rubripirellula sp.]
MSNRTTPSTAKFSIGRSNVSIAPALLVVAMMVLSSTGCDTQQHLANSHTFEVTASADSKAVVPNGWRRTKYGWEHTSTWGLTAAVKPSPSMQQWIERTAGRNPAWARTTFASIRQLSPITIALIQIALITAILKVSRRFTPQPPREDC